ncbi:hypothetical protein F5I97DRAFT_2046740 [Phlebopus sp. FC_14]|nr:hypothetical protein F5I97DRAFT_2046740 [Phlebopus sp. FC_14]
MSLPPAAQEISEHPKAGTVAAPVDKQAQEADVERKIRFYGVIEAFRQGRMPDNHQIDETLSYLHDTSPVDLDKLSPEGKKLIQDSRDIIETARLIVKSKNADELFQEFIWHTRDVSLDTAAKEPGEAAAVDRAKIAEEGREAVYHLRTVLSLILTNSEVRKLLSDFSVIGRDLLAKGAVKVAERLRPEQEALAQVDKPAAEGEFVSKGGLKVGPQETPVLETKIPGTEISAEFPPREEAKVKTGTGAKTFAQVTAEGWILFRRIRHSQEGAQATKESAEQQAEQEGQQLSPEEVEAKKQSFKERMRGVREGITERLPQQHKNRAQDQFERGRKFLAEEYFPEERRDQFIFRGKKVIMECQKHEDYQDAMKWLLSLAEEYAEHGRTATERGKEKGGTIASDPALRQAMKELRELLERFANNKSMNIIFDAADAIIDDGRRDEEFTNWIKRLNQFVRRVLLEAGYVLEDDCTREGNGIRESGRFFWDEKYRAHFDNLFNSIGSWFSAMGDDPLNRRFGEDWARLTRDLLFDAEGSLKFKPELWSDIRKVIVPTLVDKVGYIPIPRIEYTDDALDLVVENLTLQGRNLFPNFISMNAHNYFKFSPYGAIPDERHHEFTFTFAQMQADMRDVAFYFRRKSGFPKVADSGLADVLLGGSGLTATVHLVSAMKDTTSVFKVKDVHVKVDTLKFSIRDSKHDLLYKTLKPLATGLVKRQIQKAIAGAIRTGMEYVDGQLVSVRDRMEEAKTREDTDRMQVLQDLFKRHKDESQGSLKAAETRSHFKVVHNKRASIIDTGHPAGWVHRTTEREEKAATGKDWRSEA